MHQNPATHRAALRHSGLLAAAALAATHTSKQQTSVIRQPVGPSRSDNGRYRETLLN